MIERNGDKQLVIPGSYDVLHKDHKRFIEAGIDAASSVADIDQVVMALVPDKALQVKGKYRPLYGYDWRQTDLRNWFLSHGQVPDFEEFNPRDILRQVVDEDAKHGLAVLSTEYIGTRIANATANIARKIIYVPPVNITHTTDIENALRATRDNSHCDWRVGAVLVRDGEIIDASQNGGNLPDSCISCPKRIDLEKIVKTTGQLQPSPVACIYPHAESKVVENAQKGDHDYLPLWRMC